MPSSPSHATGECAPRAVVALVGSPSIKAAADTGGVNERTARRWLEDPAVASAYREASQAVTSDALTTLGGAFRCAVEVLHDRAISAPRDVDRIRSAHVIAETFRAHTADVLDLDLDDRV